MSAQSSFNSSSSPTAKARKRRQRTYGSVGKLIRRIRNSKTGLRVFDPVQKAPLPITEQEILSKHFFCIRGHMKSGTNWVGNLLNLHPEVSCVGEFHWQLISNAVDETSRRLEWFRSDPEQLKEFKRQFELVMKRTVLARANRHAQWIGDRTPGTLEPISFPDAPHIRIIRDGRDVMVSRIFHLFNRFDNRLIHKEIMSDKILGQQLKQMATDSDFFARNPLQLLRSEGAVRRSARAWRRSMEQDRESMRSNSSLKLLVVKYEELIQATEAKRDEMMEFLGVDSTLSEPLNQLTTPGFQKPLQDPFYRKGKVGNWRKHMTKQAQRWFVEEAGDELIEQGYARTRHW